MTGKQIRGIMIGSVLLVGGVVYFGNNRRKKLLFGKIEEKITEIGGDFSGGGAFEIDADTSNCPLSDTKIRRTAERIYSSLYDVGVFGLGTKEEELFSTLRSIPSQDCLAAVSQRYDSLYNRNMDANIRTDLYSLFSNKNLTEYEKIVTQEIF